MGERPILFSAPMVLAILDGKKTVTRRIASDRVYARGDLLWVKESWSAPPAYDHLRPIDLADDTPIRYAADGTVRGASKRFVDADGCYTTGRGRPSIFMRRWMSRITLEITDVRAERLQSITPEDVVAEGIPLDQHRCDCEPCSRTSALCTATQSSLMLAWRELWDGINGDRSPWASNPLVWRIAFARAKDDDLRGALELGRCER
jgi:hypothetical protein